MGILDGRNLENRSVPLLKMEVDVIPAVIPCTVGNFPVFAAGGVLANSSYNASSFATSTHHHDTQYISIITSPVTDNIPLMTAGGELSASAYSISNASGEVPVSNATVCTNLNADMLDGLHAGDFSQSAHNHDGDYISLITSPVAGNLPLMTAGGELTTSSYLVGHATNNVPTNAGSGTLNTDLNADYLDGYHANAFVLINGDQTINNTKTFSGNVIISGDFTVNGTTTTVNTANLLVEDAEITVNKNETGAGVVANGGLAGIRVERGTATDFLAVFDESVDKFRVGLVGGLTSVSLEGHTHDGGSLDIPNGVGQTTNFAGAGSSTLVTFSPAAPTLGGYEVVITPKANPVGNLGEFWYEKISTTQFRVYNSGTATTGFFYVVMI